MARSIKEIQQTMLDAVAADATLSTVLTSTSAVSIWRLWLYIVAVAHFTIESLHDIFRTETDEKIATLKPHSLRWYALKATQFMYGFNLVPESDTYDTTGLTDSQIEAAKIIAHASVVEVDRGLRVKVAQNASGSLTFLSTPQLQAFKEYMFQIKDAGVKLLITSGVADSLKCNMLVYFNPLVLDSTGARLDGTATTPVQDAFNNYLNNLPFNGVFVTEFLIDALQKVDGVVIPHILDVQAQYGALAFASFTVKYTPDAGYLRITNPNDLTIQFVAQSAI